MSIKRIAKLFAAQNLRQVIAILAQLLLPPAFIHSFGIGVYGEWLVLSAVTSYLSTINYGLQTYTTMQMTIHYNRGEVDDCRHVQSAGLRILLGVLIIICLLLLVIFLIPLDAWLHLTIPLREAQWTLYLFGCEIAAGMFRGFFANSYMVIGATHRGANIGNVYVSLVLLGQLTLVFRHASFAAIAGVQLLLTLATAIYSMFDFARCAPDIKPTLRYWKQGALMQILKPSTQYLLLYSSNVLAYQMPILIMQDILGPITVVTFSITRTIYSLSRKIITMVTNALAPEITITFGQKNWAKLLRMYVLSERIILLMTIPVVCGSMLATPLLLRIWLHKGNLYRPGVCMLLGLTVAVLTLKEHKYQFQFSSNQVREISYMTLIAYSAMVLVSIPVMWRFGLVGYLITWFFTEVCQLFYLLRLNARLFQQGARIDRTPVYQFFAFLGISFAIFYWPVFHIASITYLVQGTIAVTATVALLAVSYWIFQVDEVRSILWQKLAMRFPALASWGS